MVNTKEAAMIRWKGEKGFTLLEVLIVVAVIIIIAAIALPRFLGVSEQGRKARANGDLRVLQSAIESYVLNTNAIPADEGTVGGALEGANPQIVSDYTAFQDPFSTAKEAYKYSSKSDSASGKKYYVFFSRGPNNSAGTATLDATAGTLKMGEADDIFVTNAKKTT